MNNKMLLAIGIISFIVAGILICLQNKNPKMKNRKAVGVFNKLYDFLVGKKLVLSLESIRIRIYNNTFGEDWLIKYKAILYWFNSWVIGIVAMIFVVIYFKDNLYVKMTLMLFCFEIKSLFLDVLIGDDTNFLVGIYNYSIELQQSFSMTKDVNSAIIEANNNSTNYNLIKRMEGIQRIIDDQQAMDEYIQECPNEYLQLIALNCNLVNENGDQKDADGKSVFLENLFYTNALIESEVFKRRKLQFWLKGLAPLSILPLLSFTLYDSWVGKTLPITDIFYKTKAGFLVKLAITIVAVCMFYIIKSFQKVNRKRNRNEKTRFWEEGFFKIPPIRKLVIKVSPKPNSPRGYKYKKMISESGEYTKVEYIYLRKILFAILGFVLAISVSMSVNSITRKNIIDNQTVKYDKTLVVTESGQIDSTDVEKELIGEVDVNDIEQSYLNVKAKLQDYGIVKDADFLANKIVSKEIDVLQQRINIYDILIALTVMILGYNIPEISLKLKTKMRKYEMQNEVIIFETIILIFMYHENATAELILENMSKFANIFKPQVDMVLKEIKKSDMDSLRIIVEEIQYKPFLKLIKNLIKAENIKTKDAFIALADNRRNYLADRKEDNRQEVYKSVSKSRTISLITAPLIIVFYMVVPMMYISFVQLNNTQKQLMDLNPPQQETSIDSQNQGQYQGKK